MARYVRKPDDVQAVRLAPDTGDLDLGGVAIPAGSWLVVHSDGRTEAVDDAAFTASYDPAPTPAEVPVEDHPDPAVTADPALIPPGVDGQPS